MNPICFYHKADLDGVCSAAIVKHFVPECELYGIDYGEPFPVCSNDPGLAECTNAADKRTVYMVDFSLPVEDMKRLAGVSNLVWIDHHQTAIDAYEAQVPRVLIPGLRHSGIAACEICWQFFGQIAKPDAEQMPMPEAVRLLGIYDSWRKDDPDWDKALEFQYGCRSLHNIYDPLSFDWRFMFDAQCPDSQPVVTKFIENVAEVGAGILRYQAEVNRKACEAGAHYRTILAPMQGQISTAPYPYRTLCCNTIVFSSQFFDGFYDPEKHDVMCAYCQVYQRSKVYRGDLGAKLQWKVSLYTTKDDVDCGAIAKAFGGGGHKKAAGFVCDQLPWERGQQ